MHVLGKQHGYVLVAPFPCQTVLAAILAEQATVERDAIAKRDRADLVHRGYCRHCIGTLRGPGRESSMHKWIRPVGGTPGSNRWHLELVASPSGGRKAYCVSYFEPVETLEERTFERPPDIEDRCVACDLACECIPRIPLRRAVDGLDIRRPALPGELVFEFMVLAGIFYLVGYAIRSFYYRGHPDKEPQHAGPPPGGDWR